MDLYALEMTPNKKKEENKKIIPEASVVKEHLLTKEELIADLGSNPERSFLGNIFAHGKNSIVTEKETESAVIEKETQIGSVDIIKKKDDIDKEKEDEINMIIKDEAVIEKKPKQDISLEVNKEIPKNFIATVNQVEQNFQKLNTRDSGEEIVTKIKSVFDFKKKELGSDSSPFKSPDLKKIASDNTDAAQNNSLKNYHAEVQKQKDSSPLTAAVSTNNVHFSEQHSPAEKITIEKDDFNLDKHHRKLLHDFMEAVSSGETEKMRGAIDGIAELRSSDEFECDNNAPLNVAIRKKLFESISSTFSSKNEKEIVRVFNLIDMLNLEMSPKDFLALPTEVLKAPEFHEGAIRFLMWCASEYANSPAELEKRLACFVHAGVLTSKEVHEKPEFQNVISSDVLEYAKNNLKNPFEIDRKIYQYSLAGFLNGKSFKKSEKFKELSRDYMIEIIEKYQDRTEDMDRKIKEYEITGFVLRSDLRRDEKVASVIKKQLASYIRVNENHPRKVNMRVKEYFDIGLIDQETREELLKGI